MIVEFSHVNFGYTKNNIILKNIQLTVNEKDKILIYGEPSVGKTTLLKLIKMKNLFEKKYFIEGSFHIDESKRITQIFEELHLLNNWKVIDYLELGMDNPIYSKPKIFYNNMEDLIKFFNISNIKKRKISELNLGSKQLISIIMSLLSRPHLLLADAPFSNLDTKLSQKVVECFDYYHKIYKMSWLITTPQIDPSIKIDATKIHLSKGNLLWDNQCFMQENYIF